MNSLGDPPNVFLPQGTTLPARTSRLATASAIAGAATLVAMIVSAALFKLGYERAALAAACGQLLFPAAIVCGHIALHRIRRNPAREKGRTLALIGLYIGYFNLIIAAMILYFTFART